jgi:hypothetical protein
MMEKSNLMGSKPEYAIVGSVVEPPKPAGQFRDLPFALLFVGNIIALACFVSRGSAIVSAGASYFAGMDDDYMSGDGDAAMGATTWVLLLACAAGLSAGYVSLLMRRAADVIVCSFYFKIALMCLAAVAAMAAGSFYGAFICGIFAALLVCVRACAVESRPSFKLSLARVSIEAVVRIVARARSNRGRRSNRRSLARSPSI